MELINKLNEDFFDEIASDVANDDISSDEIVVEDNYSYDKTLVL